jgi:hypothetical protein
VIQKSKINIYTSKNNEATQKLARWNKKNGHHKTYFHTRKTTNAILKKSAILENFIWNFFWYIMDLCTTGLLFGNFKKVEFRTILKKIDIFFFKK